MVDSAEALAASVAASAAFAAVEDLVGSAVVEASMALLPAGTVAEAEGMGAVGAGIVKLLDFWNQPLTAREIVVSPIIMTGLVIMIDIFVKYISPPGRIRRPLRKIRS
jgi:hypothetical protein